MGQTKKYCSSVDLQSGRKTDSEGLQNVSIFTGQIKQVFPFDTLGLQRNIL